MLIDYDVDEDGKLHLMMASELWTALMAAVPPGFSVEPGGLVKMSFTKMEKGLVASGSPSHLNPPCPPKKGKGHGHKGSK